MQTMVNRNNPQQAQPSSATLVHASNTKPQKHTGGGIMNFGMDDINMYSGGL
jgi:hypothetical protein